ncbi:ABC transporter ATP-binding protein [Candidatus Laterigemmans baculatus]|uniref:ABC transporter ATP-binding protein n=1 Tax=Candidatus Laterigemmans baculatus TaxID=2770505 RepID=UPI0013D97528|nr:ABC transporter ATP-binding protein [Candidatus Laterigemmans baculatus]
MLSSTNTSARLPPSLGDFTLNASFNASLSAGHDAAAHRPVAAVKGIRKYYELGGEKRWILRGVDFHVQPGECVILSGPSGSGKSTLLSILGCLLTPDGGELIIDGRAVEKLPPAQQALIRRDLIGFIFQRFQLIRGLSAEENVALPLALQGLPAAEAKRRAGELLARVGLGDHRRAIPTRMSPGQCQRVALARAVITNPKLILADEPTAALDSHAGAEAMNLLRALVKDSGAAAVVVTHDPRILEYADRQCHIENGLLQ